VLPDVLPGCPSDGCKTVTSVLLEVASDDSPDGGANPFLAQIFQKMPLEEGVGCSSGWAPDEGAA
jgi:hypothetical protein